MGTWNSGLESTGGMESHKRVELFWGGDSQENTHSSVLPPLVGVIGL